MARKDKAIMFTDEELRAICSWAQTASCKSFKQETDGQKRKHARANEIFRKAYNELIDRDFGGMK